MSKNKKYIVIGIASPGRCNIYRMGEVNLCELSQDKLKYIYDNKLCPYVIIEPDPVTKKAIQSKKIDIGGSSQKKNPSTKNTKKKKSPK
jgi:hypothetical protein